MAIVLSDNIKTNAPKPTDSRYLNNLVPYTGVSHANTIIVSGVRYTGLTVNINGTEYWYKDGIGNGDLIEKESGGGTITGGTNGLSTDGANIKLGGNLTENTTINGCDLYTLSAIFLSGFSFSTSSNGNAYIEGSPTGELCLYSCGNGIVIDAISGTTYYDTLMNPQGIVYAGNYESTFVDRSLVTKQYVSSAISGVGTITGGTNGLGYTGKNICLGGTLNAHSSVNTSTYQLLIGSTGKQIRFQSGSTAILIGDTSLAANYIITQHTGTIIRAGAGSMSISADDEIGITSENCRVSLNSVGRGAFTVGQEANPGAIYFSCGAGNTGIKYCNVSNAWMSGNSTALVTSGWVTGYTSTLPSGGGSGENVTKLIEKTSHGFDVMDVVGWSGGTYNLAIADGTYDGEILGLVTKCHNANCFDLTQAGYVTGLTGLVANDTYFLSDATEGLLTSTKPTITGHLVKSVLVANSTTSGWVLPYAPYLLSISSGETGTSLSEFTITGNSSACGFVVVHGLNKQFVMVQVVENTAPYATIYTDVLRPNANCVCITFDSPPANGVQYKILIIN